MTGLFFVLYEAAFILISLYVSYGLKWKVSTITGTSMLFLGSGCLLFSLPHFLTPEYKYEVGEKGRNQVFLIKQKVKIIGETRLRVRFTF